MRSIAVIKSEVDLSLFLEKELGQPRKSGKWMLWHCPLHEDHTPSFAVVEDYFTCFACGAHGDIFDYHKLRWGWSLKEAMERLTNSPTPVVRRHVKHAPRDKERVTKLLEALNKQNPSEEYHQNMPAEKREYWHSEGINDALIDRYKLGYQPDKWVDGSYVGAYTIPLRKTGSGELLNIQFRLEGRRKDKYRQMAGLPQAPFDTNPGEPLPEQIILVEGAKKAIVVGDRTGVRTLGVPNKGAFGRISDALESVKRVWIVPDPDGLTQAHDLAKRITGKGRVVTLPTKPDDFFVRYGGTLDQFRSAFKWAVG